MFDVWRVLTEKRENTVPLTAATARQIGQMRRSFMAYADNFKGLATTRAELAPRFMALFGDYLRQVGGSFVDFVRMIDPNVPAERTAYRAHPSYQAAEYLRRLVSRRDTGDNRQKPVRSNVAALARITAAFLKTVADPEVVWRAFESELGFTARQIGRLKQIVGATQPLVAVEVNRPHRATVIHIPTAAEASAEAEPVQRRRPGRPRRQVAA